MKVVRLLLFILLLQLILSCSTTFYIRRDNNTLYVTKGRLGRPYTIIDTFGIYDSIKAKPVPFLISK